MDACVDLFKYMCVSERGSVCLWESLFVCYALVCLSVCVSGRYLVYMYVFMSVCNVFVFSVCVGCAVMVRYISLRNFGYSFTLPGIMGMFFYCNMSEFWV